MNVWLLARILRVPRAFDSNHVFINCPFDAGYQPIFNAITFAVYDLGFVARCARETDDSGEGRLSKIERIIEQCKFGIHDISEVRLDTVNNLPRFNMPLELGLSYVGTEGDASVLVGSLKHRRCPSFSISNNTATRSSFPTLPVTTFDVMAESLAKRLLPSATG